MKVLCTGDRHWTNVAIIRTALSSFADKDKVVIIHGKAKGADTLCGMVATELGYKVIEYPANWEQYGRSAGPIRNREMLKENPFLVLAFHNNIKESKGTKDMINISLKKGHRVILFTDTTVEEVRNKI